MCLNCDVLHVCATAPATGNDTMKHVCFRSKRVGIKGGMGNEGMRNGNEEWKWRNKNE